MTGPPEEFDPSKLDVQSVPVPNHFASADDDDAVRLINGTPPSPGGRMRKRFLPGAGSKDQGTRKERKIPGEEKVKRPVPPMPRNLAASVEKMYGGIALAVMPLDPDLATAIMMSATKAAEAWEELARQNHAVRRVLLAMIETTALGTLIAAHVPIFVLVTQRVMKGDPRVSMLGDMLAREAMDHMSEDQDRPDNG
jgi:hypothetical protein